MATRAMEHVCTVLELLSGGLSPSQTSGLAAGAWNHRIQFIPGPKGFHSKGPSESGLSPQTGLLREEWGSRHRQLGKRRGEQRQGLPPWFDSTWASRAASAELAEASSPSLAAAAVPFCFSPAVLHPERKWVLP